jgi:phage baseplate assembly protein gpV
MFHIELNHLVMKKKLAKKLKEPQKRKKQVSTNWISTLMTNYRTDNEYLKPNWDESVDRFDDMGLKEETLRGIYGYGFNKPSPIQCKGILPVIQGHDTIA